MGGGLCPRGVFEILFCPDAQTLLCVSLKDLVSLGG